MEFLLPLIVLAVGIIYFIRDGANKKERMALWTAYQAALRSGDKGAALRAGRTYYSKLRGGNLTIYDEQALTNDLSTM